MERDEQKLRGYLTGKLPEAEQLQIETEYLSSDEAFECLEEIENDLVDEYVRGEMSALERSLFEQNYLNSPSHRQKVLLSQNLLRAATTERKYVENKAAAPASSWWTNLFSGITFRQFAWAMAAVFITVLCGWLLLIPQSPTVKIQEIAKVDPTPQTASPTPEPQPSKSETLKPETQNPKLNDPKPDTRHLTPVFLLRGAFDINQTRGIGSKNSSPDSTKSQTLAIEKGVEKLTLQMKLEGESYPKYHAEIRAVDTNKAFTLTTRTKSTKNISLTIPAARLAATDYILTLSGVTAAGEVEEINQYPFRIAHQ